MGQPEIIAFLKMKYKKDPLAEFTHDDIVNSLGINRSGSAVCLKRLRKNHGVKYRKGYRKGLSGNRECTFYSYNPEEDALP